MTAPRLEIDLDKIEQNARTLGERLGNRGISITGVTKATLGSPEIAGAFLRGGLSSLGESRIENIEAMRGAAVPARMVLLRSPMVSQAERVVAHADVSFNTELEVISKLAAAAEEAGWTHGVVLMIELGDLREGIMPGDLEQAVRETLRYPSLTLEGIGTNLACRCGVVPDAKNMGELSALADSIDVTFGQELKIVSGGNSGSLAWALSGASTGRINHLRLGESLLLGREPLHRLPIDGLHTDAFTLIAEVIESKLKPSRPWGEIAQTAFGEQPTTTDRGDISQVILALGHQDTDPHGLQAPAGIEILGASSDHLVVYSSQDSLRVGAEIRLRPNYSALVRAMTSPLVTKFMKRQRSGTPATGGNVSPFERRA